MDPAGEDRPPEPGDDEKPPLEELYRTHRLRMVRLALLLVDDLPTAEDVVQDAFAGVARSWVRLGTASAAEAFLRTCVVNASRSVLRRRRTARGYVPPLPTPSPGADEAAVLSAEHREVIAALGTLPMRQREVLVLRHWSSLSEAEIATTLEISRGTVKSSSSRGLKALRSALAKTDD